jgi:hypothetical protein
MSRGKYRGTQATFVDGEYAEPNIDNHGNLVVNLSDATITALAAAIAAAMK